MILSKAHAARLLVLFSLTVLVCFGGVVTVSEPVAAQEGLSINNSVPNKPTVGEPTSISTEVTVPEMLGTVESELTVTLYIDGERAASKSLSVEDGTTTSVNFTHTFETSGETTVEAEGAITFLKQDYDQTISTTVDVQRPPSMEGAAFAVPESLEDEVNNYRENVSTELDANAFVLATKDELYVVFTQSEPTKGTAVVEGIVLDRNISEGNLTLGGIAATNVSFNRTGSEASVQQVANNSPQYRMDLVRIDAHYRRISSLTDPDRGKNITLSTTSGILVEDPRNARSFFQNVGNEARAASRNRSTDQLNATLSDPRTTHLHTFSFDTEFWASANATVDAIVLDPQSAARRFVEEYDRSDTAYSEGGGPILYVVNETFRPRSMENVSRVKSQSESLDGDVVETEVRLYQERISAQETLEHYTGCSEDKLEIQTPSGPVCLNVVQDVLLHGGVAWNDLPQTREDVLLVLGVSSRHQDAPAEFEQGRYRIEGEVVSTSRINESLPEASALVIYDMEQVGEIDYEAVANETRTLIENQTSKFTTHLHQQINGTNSTESEDSTGTHESGVSQAVYDTVAGNDGELDRGDSLSMVQSYIYDEQINGVALSRSDVLNLIRYYISQ